MLEDRLGIFIITYNRAKSLRRTLDYLLHSPFADCHISVLDNHSTDETPNVCQEYAVRFSHLSVVRHRVNIGFSANYLRAVELSDKEYTWVLGDDDHLIIQDCSDIISKIEASSSDLLIVGAINLPKWNLGIDTTAKNLARVGFPYFYITGWITGVIFRTSLFDSECFLTGYENANNFFPHFFFFKKCFERDVKIYVAEQWICKRGKPATGYGRLVSQIWAGWIYSTRYIADKKIRRIAILDGGLGEGSQISYLRIATKLFRALLIHRMIKPQTLSDVWFKMYYPSSWDLRLALLPSLVLLIIPGFILRELYYVYHSVITRKRYILKKDYQEELDEARI